MFIDDTKAYFAIGHVKDLIENKKSYGRLQDIPEVAALHSITLILTLKNRKLDSRHYITLYIADFFTFKVKSISH